MTQGNKNAELTPEMKQHLWKPGQSGNPGGLSATLKEVKRLCKELCPEAVARLWEIANQDKDLKAANEAIKIIFARGIGKELEHATLEQLTKAVEEARPGLDVDLKTLTTSQLDRIEAILKETAP